MVAPCCECNWCHWIVHLEITKMIFYVSIFHYSFFFLSEEEYRSRFQAWLDSGFSPSLRLSFPPPWLYSHPDLSKWWQRWPWAVPGINISPPSLTAWTGGKCFFPSSPLKVLIGLPWDMRLSLNQSLGSRDWNDLIGQAWVICPLLELGAVALPIPLGED